MYKIVIQVFLDKGIEDYEKLSESEVRCEKYTFDSTFVENEEWYNDIRFIVIGHKPTIYKRLSQLKGIDNGSNSNT